MTDDGKLSFATDIRPMFTDMDVEHMKAFDVDLSSRDDVEKHADAIYETVRGGTMPPPGSGEVRWTPEMCERFGRWRTQGFAP
jgi:hypothetical protein